MKRFGWAAILMALGALGTASPALAGKKVSPVNSTTFQLTPPVDAPEPDAAGTATLVVNAAIWPWPNECVTASCQGLTPREPYVVRVLVEWRDETDWGVRASGSYFEDRAVPTDRKGRLNAEVWVLSDGGSEGSHWWCTVRHIADLWIVNADGQIVLEQQ